MTKVSRCCPIQSCNEPYIGVDAKCNEPAVFCIEHCPHKNSDGLLHQMLSLKHFKKILQQKKQIMNQKIRPVVDQYNALMDSLIKEIQELKLRKNIELSLLWLRQLAEDQQQYDSMRRLYRFDFSGLTCSRIHSMYFKLVHDKFLAKQVQQIDCYKNISKMLHELSNQKQSQSFICSKISEISGIIQNGDVAKKMLASHGKDQGNSKQVLLESKEGDYLEIFSNKCQVKRNSKQHVSVFSKYPLLPHVAYHVHLNTKYTNAMLGVCTQKLFKSSTEFAFVSAGQSRNCLGLQQKPFQPQKDRHYSSQSLVINCANGCVYKGGMFEGGNSLTKGQKQLSLRLKITANEMMISLGKHLLNTQRLDDLIGNNGFRGDLYLHILLRTEGDEVEVERDNDASSSGNIPESMVSSQKSQHKSVFLNAEIDQIEKCNDSKTLALGNIEKNVIQDQSQNRENEKGQSLLSSNSFKFKYQNALKPNEQFRTKLANLTPKSDQIYQQPSVLAYSDYIEQQRKEFRVVDDNPKPACISSDLITNEQAQKTNQIIKKERVDSILNEIRSKSQASNLAFDSKKIISKKLKEIQEKKSFKNEEKPNFEGNVSVEQKKLSSLKYNLASLNKKLIDQQQSSQIPQITLKKPQPSNEIFNNDRCNFKQKFLSVCLLQNCGTVPRDKINNFQFEQKEEEKSFSPPIYSPASVSKRQKALKNCPAPGQDYLQNSGESKILQINELGNQQNFDFKSTFLIPKLTKSSFSKMAQCIDGNGHLENSFGTSHISPKKQPGDKKKQSDYLSLPLPNKISSYKESSIHEIDPNSEYKSSDEKGFHLEDLLEPMPNNLKTRTQESQFAEGSIDTVENLKRKKLTNQSVVDIKVSFQ